jgi:hypothetical protein
MTSRLNGLKDFLRKTARALGAGGDDDDGFRALIALAGGPNARATFDVLPGLVFFASEIRLVHASVRGDKSDPFAPILERARSGRARVEVERIVAPSVLDALVDATRSCDLAVVGASVGPRPFGDPFLVDLARRCRCPVLLLKRSRGTLPAFRERRALVVGERGQAARLGLERALRWADVASTSFGVLLGRGDGSGNEPESFPERVSSVERSSEPLDAARVTAAIDKERPNTIIVASDAATLENGSWLDEIASRTHLPMAIALSGDGPCTRRRARARQAAIAPSSPA